MRDFTGEPLGKQIYVGIPDIDPITGHDVGEIAGEIKVCPYCGRRGLAQKSDIGDWTYTHSEGAEQLSGGQVVMRWDTCPVIPPAENH